MSSESPTPPLVLGFVSVRHSCRAIARTGLAYSNIGRQRWLLAYLDLPLQFLLFGALHAAHLDTFASQGTASAHLERPDGVGAVKPPARARLIWLVLLGAFVVLFVFAPVALLLVIGPSSARAALLTYLMVVVGVPLVGYGGPAVVQLVCIGRTARWKKAAKTQTGREAAWVAMLAAWPTTGGGRRGTGDGFRLITALAADARARNQIMVGAARGRRLANKYVTSTGAVQSPTNPRHLRWP